MGAKKSIGTWSNEPIMKIMATLGRVTTVVGRENAGASQMLLMLYLLFFNLSDGWIRFSFVVTANS